MKLLLIVLSLIAPAGLLLLFWLFPAWDITLQVPLLHFYLVTFFTIVASAVAGLTAITLRGIAAKRHQLLAAAYIVMGAIFFIHGALTPEALVIEFHPGVRWAAWLTLFMGGMIFFTAALDRPGKPLPLHLPWIYGGLALFYLLFILIVMLQPDLLARVDAVAAPWHQQAVFLVTFLSWSAAALLLWRTWGQTRRLPDLVMTLVAAWSALGTISMHGFQLWHLSWWLYHLLLVTGAVTALLVLIREYEQQQQFRLTFYYAAVGMIVTTAAALFAANLFSTMVAEMMPANMDPMMVLTAVVAARRDGLLIAGLSTGFMFLLMGTVVYRAEAVIVRRNQELRTAYRELQEAEGMRDDLTGMIIHDLRSPLTSIKLGLDLLPRVIPPLDEAQTMLTRLQGAVGRMMEIINQLLDLGRMEKGQFRLEITATELTPLLQSKMNLFVNQAEEDGKTLALELADQLPPVMVDRELISRVLDNLLSNALKFTGRGGTVTLAAAPNGDTVCVTVTDTGEGIAPDAAARIFDKYYQVEGETGRPLRAGTGLGLTFCKLAVEAHDGRIWVDSRLGEGSAFSFALPLRREAE